MANRTNPEIEGRKTAELYLGEGQRLAEPAKGIQENQRTWMREIIARLNDLFEGELTDQDRLVHLNEVLKGKLVSSRTSIRRTE